MPLLSQMSMDDSSWWLLDSGASATVLAEGFATCYGVSKKSGGHHGDQFKAANGTAVNMSGKAEVGVKVVMVDEWGTQRSQRDAQLKAMVGDIQHNIISTTSLCKAGWEFWQGDTWFELRNKRTGEIASEVGYFAGCPWIRLQACKAFKVVSFVVPGDAEKNPQLSPLTRKDGVPRKLCGSVRRSRHRKDGVPRKLCGSVRWSRHTKDGVPRKLCGSERWSRHRKDGVPRKLCGSVK